MGEKLTQRELHRLFLEDISSYAEDIEDTGHKPLRMHLKHPYNRDIKAYIWNCTAPPGGRTIDEYKVQLILENQKRGERGSFDDSDGTVLIVGFAIPLIDQNMGLWTLFELDKHRDFAYSANIQVYLRQLLKAFETDVYTCQKHNKETVVICTRKHLPDALSKRFSIDLQNKLRRIENGIT